MSLTLQSVRVGTGSDEEGKNIQKLFIRKYKKKKKYE